ncbi:MAG: hypothetical protein JW902_02480 [Syntrophaceae bacterium]|nr:hypothetical protein [Syntrophaceae bacterium]
MYSKCPQCGYRFSWIEKWRLSTKRAYPCPQCQAGLLKDKKSERYLLLGICLLFVPELALGLLSALKQGAIPDIVELPLCLLIALPPFILSLICIVKGFKSARLEVVENQKTG